MSNDRRDAQDKKRPKGGRNPSELLLLGFCGLALLLAGAALDTATGDILATTGFLIVIGGAVLFFLRWTLARQPRE